MIGFNINDENNQRPDSDFKRLVDMLMPPPVVLTSAPTTAGKQLPNNLDNGYHSTNWYINLGGTVRKIVFTNV